MAGPLPWLAGDCVDAGKDVVRAGGDTAIVGEAAGLPVVEGLLLIACFLFLAIVSARDNDKSRAKDA